jgi:hypothetical protein
MVSFIAGEVQRTLERQWQMARLETKKYDEVGGGCLGLHAAECIHDLGLRDLTFVHVFVRPSFVTLWNERGCCG